MWYISGIEISCWFLTETKTIQNILILLEVEKPKFNVSNQSNHDTTTLNRNANFLKVFLFGFLPFCRSLMLIIYDILKKKREKPFNKKKKTNLNSLPTIVVVGSSKLFFFYLHKIYHLNGQKKKTLRTICHMICTTEHRKSILYSVCGQLFNEVQKIVVYDEGHRRDTNPMRFSFVDISLNKINN